MSQQLQQSETSLTISRTFDADIGRVWAAFTEPEQLGKWYAPGTMRVAIDKFDLKEGGSFEIRMIGAMAPDAPEETHAMKGVFKTIQPKNKLVHTWSWVSDDPTMQGESQVAVTLAEAAGKTTVTLEHTGLPNAESVESHSQGWAGCLENLEKKGL